MQDNRTLGDLALEAMRVQDACNLSGIVLGFGRALVRLRALLEAEGKIGTRAVNEHAIAVLWSSKIASLTHSELGDRFSVAYHWACDQQPTVDDPVDLPRVDG